MKVLKAIGIILFFAGICSALILFYFLHNGKFNVDNLLESLIAAIPFCFLGAYLVAYADEKEKKKTEEKGKKIVIEEKKKEYRQEEKNESKREDKIEAKDFEFSCPNCSEKLFFLEGTTEADCPFCGEHINLNRTKNT